MLKGHVLICQSVILLCVCYIYRQHIHMLDLPAAVLLIFRKCGDNYHPNPNHKDCNSPRHQPLPDTALLCRLLFPLSLNLLLRPSYCCCIRASRLLLVLPLGLSLLVVVHLGLRHAPLLVRLPVLRSVAKRLWCVLLGSARFLSLLAAPDAVSLIGSSSRLGLCS
jgi:hypothetical protein